MSSILVVDDDIHVLEVIGEMLRQEGHGVSTAVDGREGVEKFQRDVFDLVIIDLIMPDREGLETITELKSCARTTPIIAISGGGRVGPGDYLETARFIGASAALAKPFARSELLKAVNDLLASPNA